MAIDPKGFVYFSPHTFSPTERTHCPYYKIGFIKLQIIFYFTFLFANVGGEPRNSGLNDISTQDMRKVLGHVRMEK